MTKTRFQLLNQKRLCMQRLRAERRGQCVDGLPKRLRALRGDGQRAPMPTGRRDRLVSNGLLSCSFDAIGGPVHGDALERLEKITR
jgi:hypothetical protein